MASKPPPGPKKPDYSKARQLLFGMPSVPRMPAARPQDVPIIVPATETSTPAEEYPEIEVVSESDATDFEEESAQESAPASKPRSRDDLVLRWAAVLDRVDYLALLKLPPVTTAEPSDAGVRRAFHAFATAFHPDHYRAGRDDVREAAAHVYNRGTEAYRVLLDPLLRKRYLRLLAEGQLRISPEELEGATVRLDSGVSETIAEIAKTAAAQPFAVKADELLKKGDLKHARLQVQLALGREPKNTRLAERLRELEETIARPRGGSR